MTSSLTISPRAAVVGATVALATGALQGSAEPSDRGKVGHPNRQRPRGC